MPESLVDAAKELLKDTKECSCLYKFLLTQNPVTLTKQMKLAVPKSLGSHGWPLLLNYLKRQKAQQTPLFQTFLKRLDEMASVPSCATIDTSDKLVLQRFVIKGKLPANTDAAITCLTNVQMWIVPDQEIHFLKVTSKKTFLEQTLLYLRQFETDQEFEDKWDHVHTFILNAIARMPATRAILILSEAQKTEHSLSSYLLHSISTMGCYETWAMLVFLKYGRDKDHFHDILTNELKQSPSCDRLSRYISEFAEQLDVPLET